MTHANPAAMTPSGSSSSTTGPPEWAAATTALRRITRHGHPPGTKLIDARHAGHGGDAGHWRIPAVPGGVGGVGTSQLLEGDAGDVSYPCYLINGRIPAAPTTFSAKPGQRIRIRIINAGSDTAFRVALAGHRMTVTHTDGFPVVPTEVDAVLLGMGERYDVVVTAGDGVFPPLVASAEGKNAIARALLSTGAGSAPDPAFRPPELQAEWAPWTCSPLLPRWYSTRPEPTPRSRRDCRAP